MTYRVYYNSRHDPHGCWSVDEGTTATERVVGGVVVSGCLWCTQELPRAAMVDKTVTPVAWIAVEAAAVAVIGNKVVFVPHPQETT